MESALRGKADAGEVLGGCAAGAAVFGVRRVFESACRLRPTHEARARSTHPATKAASRFNSPRISVGISLFCMALMMFVGVTAIA